MKSRLYGIISILLVLLCVVMLAGCNSCAVMASLNNGDEPLDVIEAFGSDVFGAYSQTVSKLEISIPESGGYTAVDSRTAYDTLTTDAQRKAYRAMENSLFAFTNEGGGENGRCQLARAYIPRLSSGEIYMVKEAVTADHPEVFWLCKAYDLEYNFKEGDYMILYSMYSYDEALVRVRALENAISAYLCDMTKGLDEYEREKFIHDRLVTECDYDSGAASSDSGAGDASSAYGALVNHRAVCGGYTAAMKLLMDRVGIESIPVRGTAEGVGHVWLLTNIEGEWYHLDPTWDDPVVTEATLTIHYDYFNISDDMVSQDHDLAENYSALTEESIRNGEAGNAFYNFTVPKAKATTYNFYEHEALKVATLSDASAEMIMDRLDETVAQAEHEFYISFADEMEPDAAYEWLVGGNGVLKKTKYKLKLISHTGEGNLSRMKRIYGVWIVY